MTDKHQPTQEKEATGVVMSLQEILDARGPGSLHQVGLDMEAEFLAFWYDTHAEIPTRKDYRAWCWDYLRKKHLEKCLTRPITNETND